MIQTYTEEELLEIKKVECSEVIDDFDEPAHLASVYEDMKEAYQKYCFLRDLYIDLNRRSGEKERQIQGII